MSTDLPGVLPGLARLRAMAGATRAGGGACDLCAAGLPDDHGHVVNAATREVLCACRPCYLLFAHEGASGGRFRAVPDRYLDVGGPAVDAVWDAMQIPVGVAFFVRLSSRDRVIALYPGPAGVTESELALEAWSALVAAAPAAASMAPDVEGVLVRRDTAGPGGFGGGGTAAYIVPIDLCYELIGRLRQAWRGFQGGSEAWRALDDAFARAAARARRAVTA